MARKKKAKCKGWAVKRRGGSIVRYAEGELLLGVTRKWIASMVRKGLGEKLVRVEVREI